MRLKKVIKRVFIAFLAIYLLNLTNITTKLYLTVTLSNFTHGEGYIQNAFVSNEIYKEINVRKSKKKNPEISFDIYNRTPFIVVYWITGAKAIYFQSENTYDEYFRNINGESIGAAIIDITLDNYSYKVTDYNELVIPFWMYLKEKIENYF